jgi:hypothetical protein
VRDFILTLVSTMPEVRMVKESHLSYRFSNYTKTFSFLWIKGSFELELVFDFDWRSTLSWLCQDV